MPEAYLFAAAEAEPANEAVEAALRSAGARAAWVSEVHWLGQPLPDLCSGLAGKAFFDWPDAPLLALFSLQALLRALQNGAADLLILGQSTPDGAAALLLGSPAAVGRWNLPPLARLDPLPLNQSSAVDFLAGLAAQAAARLEEGETLVLASCAGLAESDLQAAFPGTALRPGNGLREAVALSEVAGLVHELIKLRARTALLAGFRAQRGQGGLGLWIERL